MFKKSVSVLLPAMLLLFAACSSGGQSSKNYTAYTDFEGTKLGVLTGSVGETVTMEIGATPAYYSEVAPGIEDVKKGRVEGYLTDLSILRIIAAVPENDNLKIIEVPESFFSAISGAISLDQDFIDSFNSFLAEVEADGTLARMYDRWLGENLDLESPMPDIPLTGENGTLRVATTGTLPPFDLYGDGGQLKGYAIELTLRYAASVGKDVEFTTMDFGALLPYVVSGKADFAITNIFITEERKQSVLFTDPFYTDMQGIITLK